LNILAYLSRAPELARLCSQNGFIDNDMLRADVVESSPQDITLAVSFEEVIMEGSGCVAARQPCYGRVRLQLNPTGGIAGLQVL
jgi:hypothetical protein